MGGEGRGAGGLRAGGVLKRGEKKVLLYTVFPKRPCVAHMFNHSWWRLAVGGCGGWRLATGGWWQLVVGGWWSLGAVLKGGPYQKKIFF